MPLSPYPGIDPFAPSATPAGFGAWPTPNEAVGSDTRSAANLMTMGENLTDRSNFIGHRLYDIVSGGTYAFTATITTANGFVWNGTALRIATDTKFDSAKTTNIGDPGGSTGVHHVVVNPDSDITIGGSFGHPGSIFVNNFGAVELKNGSLFKLDSGASSLVYISSGSTFQLSSGATYNQQADNNRTGADLPSGTGAIRGNRTELTAPSASGTWTPTGSETYKLPTIASGAADIVQTLGTPSAPVDVIVYTLNAGDALALGHDYVIKANTGAAELARFSNASFLPGVLGLRYTGSKWIITTAIGGSISYTNSGGSSGVSVWG